jgi:hypothetical protein
MGQDDRLRPSTASAGIGLLSLCRKGEDPLKLGDLGTALYKHLHVRLVWTPTELVPTKVLPELLRRELQLRKHCPQPRDGREPGREAKVEGTPQLQPPSRTQRGLSPAASLCVPPSQLLL